MTSLEKPGEDGLGIGKTFWVRVGTNLIHINPSKFLTFQDFLMSFSFSSNCSL